ncbi:hypothetical protein [Roseococcus pinisoli]|uniref:DUF4439 domain-containing protein n=1 Tax=Roseococcus pinisoli TaxID=2835040 RepID=A0ABS5QIB1_9PROT|nr:hypothetical protein [Roseococcus pinisoli]MBS7813339.1 hypothetical protein [Roseococcus pinisoli]
MTFVVPPFRSIAFLGAFGVLAGCVAPEPPPPAPLLATPGDPCGAQTVAFSGAGDLFAEPPGTRAPFTRAEIEPQLVHDNIAMERLQIAFDALLHCRAAEAYRLRAGTSPGFDNALRRDIGHAAQLNRMLADRGARLDAAVERVSPGSRAAVSAALTSPVPPQAVTPAPVVLRLRPDHTSPIVARLPANTRATLRAAAGSFSLADAGPQARGYALTTAFTVVPEVQVAGDPLWGLTATNLARRQAFAQDVAIAERSGTEGRFTPAD